MTRSLGTPSSIPRYATSLGSHRGVHRPLVRGGEGAPSDLQVAFTDAYQAWLAREEEKTGQLNMFACQIDESAGLAEETRYSQISELPGVTFEDIFQR